MFQIMPVTIAPSAAVANAPKPPVTRSAWQRIVPYLYVLPATALLIVWTYRPLVEAFQLSFYQWNMLPNTDKKWVGLDNYAGLLALPELRQALLNTAVYMVAALMFTIVLPVVFALIAQKLAGRWKTFYQALIFVPFLVVPVASSAVWRWMLDEHEGLINLALQSVGLDLGNILRNPDTSLIAVIVIVGWQMLGFGVLVVAAGIAGINPDYASAAALDRASPRRIRWMITLPLLSPTLAFLVLMTILLAAQWSYPVIDILTQGGPNGASNNIYYLLYQIGFENFDAGTSAAAGMLFFAVFMLIAWAFVEIGERLSFHDS